MISRRAFVAGSGSFAFGAGGVGGYALGVEPWQLGVTRNRVHPPRWPEGLALRLAAIADVHACEPWMGIGRLRRIVARTNALAPDVVVLLGDYTAAHRWVTGLIEAGVWAPLLGGLRAPLGAFAVLGNHDWWDDPAAQQRGGGPVLARLALEEAGIPVLENDAVRLAKGGQRFWLAGLGDQLALRGRRRGTYRGVDDLAGTIARIADDAPAILLAHEPDIFPQVPSRIALTLSGHTHGGQVRALGYSPIVPSRYGNRYAYGHVVEDGRHLVVSGGLGCSIAPVRLGVPPEIVLVEVSPGKGA
jgi:predicted MPP superfamily phosphohydrolase